MARIILGTFTTLLVIFIVPLIVYGLLSGLLGMETPTGSSPARFLLGVLVSKVGTALLMTLLFYLARGVFRDNWMVFSLAFILMFVLGEVGQAIGPGYSWKEALSGIVSELIYVPVSVLILRMVMR